MKKTKNLTLCALLLALALGLSYMERFIPLQLLIPLPGIKLGIANVVIMAALMLLGPQHSVMILLGRCFLGAVFGGGVTGFLFSLMGGALSLAVMIAAGKSKSLSIYGISILGAAAHNIGQITAAVILMRSVYVAAYLPYLLLAAVVTGTLTAGLCAGVFKVLPKALSAGLPEERL